MWVIFWGEFPWSAHWTHTHTHTVSHGKLRIMHVKHLCCFTTGSLILRESLSECQNTEAKAKINVSLSSSVCKNKDFHCLAFQAPASFFPLFFQPSSRFDLCSNSLWISEQLIVFWKTWGLAVLYSHAGPSACHCLPSLLSFSLSDSLFLQSSHVGWGERLTHAQLNWILMPCVVSPLLSLHKSHFHSILKVIKVLLGSLISIL